MHSTIPVGIAEHYQNMLPFSIIEDYFDMAIEPNDKKNVEVRNSKKRRWL